MTSREFKYHYEVRTRKFWWVNWDMQQYFTLQTFIKKVTKADKQFRKLLKLKLHERNII